MTVAEFKFTDSQIRFVLNSCVSEVVAASEK